jgi:predicted membrane channel-forming protein YqfA (hemolysin III family)
MVYFQTKNINLGKFWRALDWKMSIYFMAIRNVLRTIVKFYDHFVHFVLIFGTFFPVLVSRSNKNLATPGMVAAAAAISPTILIQFTSVRNEASHLFFFFFLNGPPLRLEKLGHYRRAPHHRSQKAS